MTLGEQQKKYKRQNSQFFKQVKSEFFKQVKSEFQTDSFTASVEERIQSNYTASLRKGDYIKFYTEIHDIDKDKAKARIVKKAIDDLLIKAGNVFPKLSSPRQAKLDPDIKRALAVSVVDQLFQYDLLNEDQITQLIENKKLFPQEINNPFIMNVQTELKFRKENPDEIISSISEEKEDHSLRKRSEIRVGATIFLEKGDKESLSNLADLTDGENFNETNDGYAFWIALHDHLIGKTGNEQVNILFNLSKNTGNKLEDTILMYALTNLGSNDLKEQFYNKMAKETHNSRDLLKPPYE